MDEKEIVECKGLRWPNNPDSKETYPIKLSKEIWMDRTDIKEEAGKEFFGITPGKLIRIKYGPVIQINTGKFKKDEDGNIIEIRGRRLSKEEEAKVKPKGVLSWVSSVDAFEVEVRNYDHLFTTPNPDAEKFYDQLNKDSKKVYPNALVNKDITLGMKSLDRFQFERYGFYTVDKDSDIEKGKIVFNLTVGLVDKARTKAVN